MMDKKELRRELEEIRARWKNRGGRLDDDGRWITTENGHHVHLNDKGEPDKGNPHVISAMSGKSSSSRKKVAKIDKKGTPSAKDLGVSEAEIEKARHAYMKKNGIANTWDLTSKQNDEIVKEATKSAPKHVKTKDCDYEIDHYDRVGGHFSYKGTAKGYTVGKEYDVPGADGQKAKVSSIHVYPNGEVDITANYTDESGLHRNCTFH